MKQISEMLPVDLSERVPRTLQQHLAEALVPHLLPYGDAVRQLQKQMAEFARGFAIAMDELKRTWKPFFDQMLPVMQKLAEIDWAAVVDDYERSFLYMAHCGWTLPAWIGLGELRTLHLKSEEDLDRYFVEGFMANDAENLKKLGERLKKKPGFAPWYSLIDDIVGSIEEGRYRVAIPATLTIMDGYLANALVRASLAEPSVISPFKVLREARWHEHDTFPALFWKAGMVFLSRVFAPSDFTQQPPTFINRHWILHGRAPVAWTLSDALRLANSLATLDFLFVTIGQPKPDDLRWRGDPNDGFTITRGAPVQIQ